MMLRKVVLLLMVFVLIVVSTMGTVCNGCFAGNRRMTRDGGVALLLRWSSIVASRSIHGWVRLCWTWGGRRNGKMNCLSLFPSNKWENAPKH